VRVTSDFIQIRNYFVLQTVAMMITVALIPRLRMTSIFGALLTVVALAFVNATMWDAALFFSLPASFSTHALLLLGANGLLFWILVKLLPGIEIEGFLPAIAAPVVFTLVSLAVNQYGREIDWQRLFQWLMDVVRVTKEYFLESASKATPPAHP
jgi:putative membrane protein